MGQVSAGRGAGQEAASGARGADAAERAWFPVLSDAEDEYFFKRDFLKNDRGRDTFSIPEVYPQAQKRALWLAPNDEATTLERLWWSTVVR